LPLLPAQKIDNETASRERVVRVQTALNHLTVIEVAEPVTTVAVGSPQAFKIERRENKVLIQPLQDNVATNLFIWTATTRLNYELVPAVTDAGEMDFAIDYGKVQAHPQPQAQVVQPKPAPQAATVNIPSEMLLGGIPIRLVGNTAKASDRNLVIRDVYRKEDEVFVRYSIENQSAHMFRAGVPTVVSLSQPKLASSLWPIEYSQLGADYESRLKTKGVVPVRITRCDPGVADVAPGQLRIGVMTLELPSASTNAKSGQPTVLRFQVPVDQGNSLTATLVL
jgi:hypothetical protein